MNKYENMSFKNFILILIPLLILSCKKDDDQLTFDSEFGAIYVTVYQDGIIIPDALVRAIPGNEIWLTDFSGSVIIKDLESEIYEITATHPEYGSGTGAAAVHKGEISEVDIELIPGVFEAPVVSFIFPTPGSVVDSDSPTQFSVSVSDNMDVPQNISLEWSSNIEGILSTESAQPNGVATITVNELSEGTHRLQVIATDTDGFIGGSVVEITVQNLPNSVVLDPPTGLNNGVQLNWSTSNEPDFSHYAIYRAENTPENFQLINTISDVNQTTFFDNAVSIGDAYYYRIAVVSTSNNEGFSNVQFILFEGVSIYVGTTIERMIVDPSRPYIYALDKSNNSLLFINTDEGNVSKTIYVGSSPTDLDITFDGNRLYVANFGSSQIAVVNLEAQELDFNVNVNTNAGTWEGNPYRLAVMSNNRLAFTSEDQWNNIKVVNAITGTLIAYGTSIYEPTLYTDPNGNILYAAEASSTGCQVFRYSVSGSNITEEDESSSGYAMRNSFISGNGDFIFFRGRKIQSNNLQVSLGTFPSEVYACNYDGSIVLGSDKYYSGLNFSILGNLPISSTIIASDPNEDIFYLFNNESKSLIVFNP